MTSRRLWHHRLPRSIDTEHCSPMALTCVRNVSFSVVYLTLWWVAPESIRILNTLRWTYLTCLCFSINQSTVKWVLRNPGFNYLLFVIPSKSCYTWAARERARFASVASSLLRVEKDAHLILNRRDTASIHTLRHGTPAHSNRGHNCVRFAFDASCLFVSNGVFGTFAINLRMSANERFSMLSWSLQNCSAFILCLSILETRIVMRHCLDCRDATWMYEHVRILWGFRLWLSKYAYLIKYRISRVAYLGRVNPKRDSSRFEYFPFSRKRFDSSREKITI